MLFLQFLFNLLIIKQSSDLIQFEFDNFVEKYNKPYKNNRYEYQKRIQIFQDSMNQIQYLNSMRKHKDSAYYGVTKYSDLSKEEFLKLLSHRGKKDKVHHKREANDGWRREVVGLGTKLDWKEKGAVSEVRNQGKCGACWAHSTVATVESMLQIRTGRLTEFSVQQLVDCSGEQNEGCRGGDTCSTLDWMSKNNVKLETATDYPTQDDAGPCRMDPNKPGVRIQANYTCDSFVNHEALMIKLLAKHGPLIAAVDASTWQHYLGGIIQYHCYDDLNHAIQITGYDLTGDLPYYKVRNTWSTEFGINGYVHLAIGQNICGIAEEVSALDVTDIAEVFIHKKNQDSS